MEGDDGGSQAGDCAVGAGNEERNLRRREGVALLMRPLYHTTATLHGCHRSRALVANTVFAGMSALPVKLAFPQRQRLRWGVVGGLRGGRWPGYGTVAAVICSGVFPFGKAG